ncbi:hypothetical protein TI39_contig348g00003 [Zymoseptoria brevis]|uniref:Uncharacterized protein n=1 Tax=Zymoseptoria brevis TaxID=1047168 RepID=A0A0F4GS72_9PEZI|nr:hypothetical protein TI39_contig348g00003 [Zymoseptoria brevis]
MADNEPERRLLQGALQRSYNTQEIFNRMHDMIDSAVDMASWVADNLQQAGLEVPNILGYTVLTLPYWKPGTEVLLSKSEDDEERYITKSLSANDTTNKSGHVSGSLSGVKNCKDAHKSEHLSESLSGVKGDEDTHKRSPALLRLWDYAQAAAEYQPIDDEDFYQTACTISAAGDRSNGRKLGTRSQDDASGRSVSHAEQYPSPEVEGVAVLRDHWNSDNAAQQGANQPPPPRPPGPPGPPPSAGPPGPPPAPPINAEPPSLQMNLFHFIKPNMVDKKFEGSTERKPVFIDGRELKFRGMSATGMEEMNDAGDLSGFEAQISDVEAFVAIYENTDMRFGLIESHSTEILDKELENRGRALVGENVNLKDLQLKLYTAVHGKASKPSNAVLRTEVRMWQKLDMLRKQELFALIFFGSKTIKRLIRRVGTGFNVDNMLAWDSMLRRIYIQERAGFAERAEGDLRARCGIPEALATSEVLQMRWNDLTARWADPESARLFFEKYGSVGLRRGMVCSESLIEGGPLGFRHLAGMDTLLLAEMPSFEDLDNDTAMNGADPQRYTRITHKPRQAGTLLAVVVCVASVHTPGDGPFPRPEHTPGVLPPIIHDAEPDVTFNFEVVVGNGSFFECVRDESDANCCIVSDRHVDEAHPALKTPRVLLVATKDIERMETLRVLHNRSRSSASEFNKNMQRMLTDGGDTPAKGTFFIRFGQLTQCLYDMNEADVKNKASGEQDRDLVRDLVRTEHL